jgi:glutamyl-tRNA reductase
VTRTRGTNRQLHVGALGTDFKSASLRMRDALYLDDEKLLAFFKSIPDDAPLREVVALSTCNRIEIYYVCDDHAMASSWLRDHLVEFHGMPRPHLDRAFKEFRCAHAVRHLLQVVSGTESMVFGEHEILGQVRDAYHLSHRNKTTSSYLNRLFQHAVATGKKVRSLTGAGRGALSVGSIAVERIIELCGSIDKKDILVAGAGTMGIRTVKRLRAANAGSITLVNRTNERAQMYCEHFGLRFLPWSEFRTVAHTFDVIVLATASQQHVLSAADFPQAAHESRRRLVVDLGAPRNADPAVGALPGLTLVCIDDLKEISERRLADRRKDTELISAIIEEQVDKFTKWYNVKTRLVCSEP